MHTEVTNPVFWAAGLGLTASITLAIIFLAHKKARRMVTCRHDSVQYLFTVAVQARTPRVTYLDFPAPPPPSQDAIHEPTVLRTFERTVTKLRFSDAVEVWGTSDSSTLNDARDVLDGPIHATSRRRTGRSATLQITPVANTSASPALIMASWSESAPSIAPMSRNSPSPSDSPRPGHDSTFNLEATPPIPGPSEPCLREPPGPSTVVLDDVANTTFSQPSGVNDVSEEPRCQRSSPGVSRLSDASDVAPPLIHHKRYSGKIGEGVDAIVVFMYWWETTSPERIQAPPNLSHYEILRLGDLFLHRHNGGIQIWIWTEGDRSSLWWKKIPDGYARADGRILAFTEVNKQPSWLDPDWHSACRRQRRL